MHGRQESSGRGSGKSCTDAGKVIVPPGWYDRPTRVEHLCHPGGTPVPPWWDDNFMRAKQEVYAGKAATCRLQARHFSLSRTRIRHKLLTFAPQPKHRAQ